MSIENQIYKAISNHKRGKIFFPDNFKHIGTETAVRKALSRLQKDGKLIRLAQGIYLYPKTHKLLGVLVPSSDDVAIAVAKRDKARIIPTASQALNRLGLSTQVPMNVVYLTDGSTRVLKVGNRKIRFKKASPKLLSAKDDTILLIILALKEIGKDGFTKEVKSTTDKILTQLNKENIKHDMKLAPGWIADYMKSFL